jgi:hypothetical protein
MLAEEMNYVVRLILAGLGVVVLTGLPWIFHWSQPMGWLSIALLIAWTVWLVYEYLTWARRLRP